MIRRALIPLLLFAFCLPAPAAGQAGRNPHPWPAGPDSGTVEERFAPPEGYARIPQAAGSFGAWLRGLPVKPGRPDVMLYNGRPKLNQHAHAAVLDLDAGSRDLMQCADAVMRLRAEYLWASNRKDAIAFNFTSGDRASWEAWSRGMRPLVRGNRVQWKESAAPDSGYKNFRRYLDTVFTYAGSYSLSRELSKAAKPSRLLPGDVFIKGGFPGHAVLVLDVAENEKGERVFLLCQSYMPAQEIQVLKNPSDPKSPWYPARDSGVLETPEWTFSYSDCRSFPGPEK